MKKTLITLSILLINFSIFSQFGLHRNVIDSTLLDAHYNIVSSSNAFTLIQVEKRINIAYLYDENVKCEAIYILKNDSCILARFIQENNFIFNGKEFSYNDQLATIFVENHNVFLKIVCLKND
jgi:hypothetical protein